MAEKTGLWLIGARGSVATTTAVGLAALQRGAVAPTGLVTELPMFAGLGLVGWDRLVLGGHELRGGSLYDSARAIAERDRSISPALVAECETRLAEADSNIRPGVCFRSGAAIEPDAAADTAIASPRAGVERIKGDLQEFAARHGLARVVVVLLASTEPETPAAALPARWRELERTLDSAAACPLRAGSLYAIAALELGMPFVNFTPSLGSDCEALRELALDRGACHAGRDGKTGETLLKTVLAPMFAARNLEVMSWVGHNILGNADGRVLDHPDHKASKVQSKDAALGSMLGYQPQTHVSIEYVPSLGDRKTAWDHVHFRGFLGAEMTLQFTWQGCDSALAAPLVLDLARLADCSARRGEAGVLSHLASFFKSPLGGGDHSFYAQLGALADYAASARGAGARPS